MSPNWDKLIKKELDLKPGSFNKNEKGHPYWVPGEKETIVSYYNVHWMPLKKCRGRVLSGFILVFKCVIVTLADGYRISFLDF